MTARVTLTEDQRSALLAMLQACCAVFWGPDPEKCREMLSTGYFRPFDAVGSVITCEPPDTLKLLKDLVLKYSDAVSLFDSLEASYVTLFVNARGGVAAPLYQSCYVETTDPPAASAIMGAPALMMQQRLSAAALSLEYSSNEPPDHLAIEIEYLYFLLQKGWGEHDAAHRQEAVSFVKTELLGWVPRFEERLRITHPDSFYTLAAALLVGALRLIADC